MKTNLHLLPDNLARPVNEVQQFKVVNKMCRFFLYWKLLGILRGLCKV